jgi:hypothetical protein
MDFPLYYLYVFNFSINFEIYKLEPKNISVMNIIAYEDCVLNLMLYLLRDLFFALTY